MKTAVITWLFVLALPSVAYAHGGGAQHGYTSTVDHIVNAGGVDAQASGDGHFSFTAPAGHVVIVRGYGGEPYLRFAGGKIDENEAAPTTFINNDKPLSSATANTSTSATPQWKEIASGLTYTWHDHRTHWMAAQPPAAVQKAPHQAHHIFNWKVGGTVDGKPFQIVGSLDWGPTKSSPGYLWISYIAIAGGAVYAAFLLISSRKKKVRTSARA